MLYTRKGDKGDTYFFGCDQRFSKTSERAEALGGIDEINSLLGFCKMKVEEENLKNILNRIQEDLFIIQANLACLPAGRPADYKKISQEKINYLEGVIDAVEKELPEIKTFFIAGGSELSALLDYARAVARRAERSVVNLNEKTGKVEPLMLSYLNRLSSLLYAMARLANFKLGAKEIPPSYKQ